jgi:hypothetical protein
MTLNFDATYRWLYIMIFLEIKIESKTVLINQTSNNLRRSWWDAVVVADNRQPASRTGRRVELSEEEDEISFHL